MDYALCNTLAHRLLRILSPAVAIQAQVHGKSSTNPDDLFIKCNTTTLTWIFITQLIGRQRGILFDIDATFFLKRISSVE